LASRGAFFSESKSLHRNSSKLLQNCRLPTDTSTRQGFDRNNAYPNLPGRANAQFRRRGAPGGPNAECVSDGESYGRPLKLAERLRGRSVRQAEALARTRGVGAGEDARGLEIEDEGVLELEHGLSHAASRSLSVPGRDRGTFLRSSAERGSSGEREPARLPPRHPIIARKKAAALAKRGEKQHDTFDGLLADTLCTSPGHYLAQQRNAAAAEQAALSVQSLYRGYRVRRDLLGYVVSMYGNRKSGGSGKSGAARAGGSGGKEGALGRNQAAGSNSRSLNTRSRGERGGNGGSGAGSEDRQRLVIGNSLLSAARRGGGVVYSGPEYGGGWSGNSNGNSSGRKRASPPRNSPTNAGNSSGGASASVSAGAAASSSAAGGSTAAVLPPRQALKQRMAAAEERMTPRGSAPRGGTAAGSAGRDGWVPHEESAAPAPGRRRRAH